MKAKAKREVMRRRARQHDIRLRVVRAIAASKVAREASRIEVAS